MTINFIDKQKLVAEIKEIIKNTSSIILANYSGISANKINELRKLSHNNSIYIRIIRNTLMKRIVKYTSFECLTDYFIGPIIVGFSYEHPGLCARLFKRFADENTNFKIKVASFEGKVITSSDINYLVNLPTYKEAISSFAIIIKDAPIKKLIKALILLSKKK